MSLVLAKERVVNIDKGLNESYEDSDPDYEGHEGMEDALRCSASEYISPIDASFPFKRNNLLDLPKRMHWHVPVSFRHICFPDMQAFIRVKSTIFSNSVSQVLNVVKSYSRDILFSNHQIEGEFTCTMVHDKTELSFLGHHVNQHTIHSWVEIRPKVR
jgi:hypothetical protein